jgi:hypothetical protein
MPKWPLFFLAIAPLTAAAADPGFVAAYGQLRNASRDATRIADHAAQEVGDSSSEVADLQAGFAQRSETQREAGHGGVHPLYGLLCDLNVKKR